MPRGWRSKNALDGNLLILRGFLRFAMNAEFQYDMFLSHGAKEKAVARLLAE
jgi:hypothetical protein